MNKADLVELIAREANLSKQASKVALDTVIEGIMQALKKHDTVSFTGFCTLKTVKRPARKGRNPATGKEINIPAKTVVSFKAGKQLKEEVNR
jgi:DNA-binding protein HU-beta